MRPMIKITGALAAATLLVAACDGGPLFFAELEEPRLCKTIDNIPFEGTAPGSELRYRLGIPIASELPLFASGDGGTSDVDTEVRLIEFALLRESGILDFNAVESVRVAVQPAPGASQPEATLLSYVRDPADLPGDTLIVAGDQDVNLVPYIFDPATVDGGTPSMLDGGTAEDGTIAVEVVMSGELPEDPWVADVRACIYMRTRFNYLNAYGL